jgi:hypothetical protein
MITKELIKYIEEKISSGKNKEEIEKELLSNGWDNNDINEAFKKIPKKRSKYNISFSNNYLIYIFFLITLLLPLIVQISPLLNISFYIVTPFFFILLPILILYYFISNMFRFIFPFFYNRGEVIPFESYYLNGYSGFFSFTIFWIIFWYLMFLLFSRKENTKKIFMKALITSIPFYILGTLLLIYLKAFK